MQILKFASEFRDACATRQNDNPRERLAFVEFLALLLLVPFYWLLSALNEIGWKRGDALTRFD